MREKVVVLQENVKPPTESTAADRPTQEEEAARGAALLATRAAAWHSGGEICARFAFLYIARTMPGPRKNRHLLVMQKLSPAEKQQEPLSN